MILYDDFIEQTGNNYNKEITAETLVAINPVDVRDFNMFGLNKTFDYQSIGEMFKVISIGQLAEELCVIKIGENNATGLENQMHYQSLLKRWFKLPYYLERDFMYGGKGSIVNSGVIQAILCEVNKQKIEEHKKTLERGLEIGALESMSDAKIYLEVGEDMVVVQYPSLQSLTENVMSVEPSNDGNTMGVRAAINVNNFFTINEDFMGPRLKGKLAELKTDKGFKLSDYDVSYCSYGYLVELND